MEQIRTFIAIELPDSLKLKLSELETRLKSDGQSPAKWGKPDSIHLTLKFLGNTAVGKISEIARAMAAAAEAVPPFHLEIKGLGTFPNPKRVQVVWVGVSGELDKLARLQQGIESRLEPLGFTPEARPFVPHLTLARVNRLASGGERQQLGQLIAATEFEAGTIKVTAVSLMKSQLTREGAIHSRLASARLKSP